MNVLLSFWKPGVDHDGELADEDRQVLGGHAAARLGQRDFLALLLDGGDQDVLAAEHRHDGVFVLRDALAGDRLTVLRLALVDECRHCFLRET
jgi:hypothetical protein